MVVRVVVVRVAVRVAEVTGPVPMKVQVIGSPQAKPLVTWLT